MREATLRHARPALSGGRGADCLSRRGLACSHGARPRRRRRRCVRVRAASCPLAPRLALMCPFRIVATTGLLSCVKIHVVTRHTPSHLVRRLGVVLLRCARSRLPRPCHTAAVSRAVLLSAQPVRCCAPLARLRIPRSRSCAGAKVRSVSTGLAACEFGAASVPCLVKPTIREGAAAGGSPRPILVSSPRAPPSSCTFLRAADTFPFITDGRKYKRFGVV